MPAIPSLRQARIVMILSSVFMILLLLRNNLIFLHQSSNFVLPLLNHPGLGIMFLSTLACLLFSCVGTGTVDISIVYLVILSEASSMICKDPSLSDNILISFSVLTCFALCRLCYMCLVSFNG